MMSLGNDHGSNQSAQPGALAMLAMPASIAEWHLGSEPCLLRVDHCGVVRYEPNAALASAWASLGVDAGVLTAAQTEGWQAEGELIDDYWLNAFSSMADVREVVRCWARALAQLGDVTVEDVKRTDLDRVAEAEVLQPVTLCVNGHTIGPCWPRTRVVHRDGSRQIWEAVLVPTTTLLAAASTHLPQFSAESDSACRQGSGAPAATMPGVDASLGPSSMADAGAPDNPGADRSGWAGAGYRL